jgi:hypothetical protein
MMKRDERADRDPNALWVCCPACGHGHNIAPSKVLWFVGYLVDRTKERLSGRDPRVEMYRRTARKPQPERE